ncbi:hypothetical protein CONPUDRAFT_156961 [Coniophora puteana RWD-64-598 SS2]|uniref:Uncharacterized protein n=1 Tax=Coniophora puteana (strain RWD-64-598) TaxID=741705 RepID=A0A5M3MFK5_CONPW|nr:uncharacterized protein CONPUDRAFT_156961 [Coniophora puteana RWD-64-598 SS2]EIW77776.1 hypothetical protein CONPUDRAFT_156961 [Coniophora puteana RWD-64-598 SS2]
MLSCFSSFVYQTYLQKFPQHIGRTKFAGFAESHVSLLAVVVNRAGNEVTLKHLAIATGMALRTFYGS